MQVTIDTQTLAEKLAQKPTQERTQEHGGRSLRILDASWYLPTENRDPRAEFQTAHICDAQFFDIDAVCDLDTDLPHMLPSAQDFATAVGNLGISSADTVVIYDGSGLFSAARLWWMFKTFGHEAVFVLDGGLPKWQREGREICTKHRPAKPARFRATFNPQAVITADALLTSQAQILDARPGPRFLGKAPEPRAGLRSGHMPGAINLFYQEVLTQEGCLKKPDALGEVLAAKGISTTAPMITTCGSGVTAAILTMALSSLGLSDHKLYDGSWSEWGAQPDLPVIGPS